MATLILVAFCSEFLAQFLFTEGGTGKFEVLLIAWLPSTAVMITNASHRRWKTSASVIYPLQWIHDACIIAHVVMWHLCIRLYTKGFAPASLQLERPKNGRALPQSPVISWSTNTKSYVRIIIPQVWGAGVCPCICELNDWMRWACTYSRSCSRMRSVVLLTVTGSSLFPSTHKWHSRIWWRERVYHSDSIAPKCLTRMSVKDNCHETKTAVN